MPEIDIREVYAEEMYDILYRLTGYAFSSTPPFPDEEEFKRYRRLRRGTRVFAAFAGEERLACAGALYLNQNMRGKIYPAMGVYGVAVEPSARRKGLGRNLLTRLLAELHAEGSVFSDLYPFRESFYERRGYVTLQVPSSPSNRMLAKTGARVLGEGRVGVKNRSGEQLPISYNFIAM